LLLFILVGSGEMVWGRDGRSMIKSGERERERRCGKEEKRKMMRNRDNEDEESMMRMEEEEVGKSCSEKK
jgi:hypothetical protein